MPDRSLSESEKDELAELLEEEEDRDLKQETGDRQEQFFNFREPRHDFTEVVGMEDVKEQLRRKVELPIEKNDLSESYGLPGVLNGVVLYGPPRTGKTHVAEGFAGETGYHFLQINAADIKNSRVGESEKNIQRLIEQARQAQPCIVLMNEVDVLASSREEFQQGYKKDVVGTFLDEVEKLSGEDVLVVGTTNFIDRVDTAFLQPGRFSEQIWVGLPGQEMRRNLFEKALERAEDSRVDWDDLDLDRLAELTEGYTCGDIVEQGIVYEAKLAALENEELVQQKHLLYAFKDSGPSVTDLEKYRESGLGVDVQ